MTLLPVQNGAREHCSATWTETASCAGKPLAYYSFPAVDVIPIHSRTFCKRFYGHMARAKTYSNVVREGGLGGGGGLRRHAVPVSVVNKRLKRGHLSKHLAYIWFALDR